MTEARRFRDLFLQILQSIADLQSKIALAFSSGLGARAIFFGLRELKRKPALYVFHAEDDYSDDFVNAKIDAQTFGLNTREVVIKSDISKTAFHDLAQRYDITEKAEAIFAYCFSCLFEQIQEAIALVGIGGNSPCPDNQRRFRLLEEIAKEYGIRLFAPFLENKSQELFPEAIVQQKQRAIIMAAFARYFGYTKCLPPMQPIGAELVRIFSAI